MRSGIRFLAAVALFVTALQAQAEEDPHANCAGGGWVPPGILGRPLPIRANTGNSKDVVTTSSDEARAYYLQGLNYLHGYSWIEGARSFQQAIRLDRDFAMAHWGLSRIYSGLDDHEKAVAAAQRAKELAAKATPREQRRIGVRLAQLDALADLGNTALFAAYRQAIDKVIAADIGDPELWLIRGNSEEPTAAGRGQRGGVASIAFYNEALRVAPDNGAAHHYLTHSYENLNQIDRALVHGEVYARLAAAIPHAHHMWGHDLRRVGRLDEAIAAFNRTNDLEKAYYAAEKIPSELDWHHVHNLDLLATAHEHKGQMRRAESLLREAAAVKAVTEYQEYNQKSLAVFLLGRERWREALAAAQALTKVSSGGTRVVGHALAGHAWLGLRDAKGAKRSLEAAQTELNGVPTLVGGIAVARAVVLPYVDALRAEMLLRDGKGEEGRALLKDVQARLRALPGPDA
jgi:tetratricopeptide (TPR) repeat protein